MDKADPKQDAGWDTEVLGETSSKQLHELEDMLEKGEFTGLANIADEAIQAMELRPKDLKEAFADGMLTVMRGQPSDHLTSGISSCAKALARLSDFFESERQAKFKVFRVTPLQDGFATEAYFEASGDTPNGRAQINATWLSDWSKDSPPRLRKIEVKDYEEIGPVNGGLRFVDETAALLGGNASYREQLQRGIDHWRDRLQGDFGVDVNGWQGLALGDANGDGLDDLYVCQQGGLPNQLYLRQANGGLREASAEAGVDWMELTRAALFVDLDNDGDQDLALAQGWYLMLMENDGKAHFTKRLEQRSEAQLFSLAAADFDGDGDLDLYFCGRNPSRELEKSEGFLGTPIPYHDANNGGPNILLKNEGDWKFRDATVETGLDVNNRRYSFACAWEDYDNDGDQDLYVANDYGRNNLYRNDDGKFQDLAAALGVEDISAGMSVAWADYNRDGRMDLYVSNMFSSAGNRIAYQRNFRGGDASQLGQFQRHARGNSLFQNDGAQFADVSQAANVTMGRWAWASLFADFNNDGWEDIYVANGFITTPDSGDL